MRIDFPSSWFFILLNNKTSSGIIVRWPKLSQTFTVCFFRGETFSVSFCSLMHSVENFFLVRKTHFLLSFLKSLQIAAMFFVNIISIIKFKYLALFVENYYPDTRIRTENVSLVSSDTLVPSKLQNVSLVFFSASLIPSKLENVACFSCTLFPSKLENISLIFSATLVPSKP